MTKDSIETKNKVKWLEKERRDRNIVLAVLTIDSKRSLILKNIMENSIK